MSETRLQGIVKRIVADRGFGFIGVPGRDDVFFHRTGLTNIRFEHLAEHDKVEFRLDGGRSGKGPRAEDIVKL